MTIKTPEQFLQSLRDGRVVYSEGKKVEDVTKHPLLSLCANAFALEYAIALAPEFRDIFVTKDENSEDVSFVFQPAKSAEDLFRRREIIQTGARICLGLPASPKFTGIDALHSLTVNSRIIDKATGSHYSERVEEYRKFLKKDDSAVCAAMTDVKGNRSLRPSKQEQHQDFYVRIVEETSEHGQPGIVVRGAKMHISGSPCSNEIIVMPCRAMPEEDKDYAVVFATPANARGITLISSAERPYEPGNYFDFPIGSSTHTASGAVIFDNVFIPMERVFLKKESQFSANFTYIFADFHRLSADAYKYARLEIVLGLAALLAEYNGIDRAPHVRDKLAWLILYAEGVEALGKAACQFCEIVPDTDLVYPNPMYSNIAKFYFADNWHQASKIVQDLAGGLGATVFSGKDYFNPETRPLIDRYFGGKAGVLTEHRLRAMHLCRELTHSAEDSAIIHGEGSLAAQRLTVYTLGDWEKYKAAAKRVARIEDGTTHPIFSKLPKFPASFD